MAAWTSGLDAHIAPDLGRSALVIIDTQVDFVDGGACPIPGTTQILPNIAHLLAAYRDAALPIVHVIRLYDGDDVDLPRRAAIAAGAPIVRPGAVGSQIAPELRLAGAPDLDAPTLIAGHLQNLGPHEVAVWKPRWSAFHRTALNQHLADRGVHTIVFAGCNYPNCPRASIYDASERDYRVLIASDAISGVEDHHLEEAGLIGAIHASSDSIIHMLAHERSP
ncbi:MAG TPA: isochorismatase family cysteine hydrolase [Pseudonocardiaceae bacterium]|jgi:nicotinamidase-related amidase|nr:isochorismatase family cysteine hydrolase [Pseudonocardiaceae bacterium]